MKEYNLKSWIIEALNYAAFPVIILFGWYQITNSGKVSSLMLPSIEMVKVSFLSQLQSGQLWLDISASVIIVIKGYLAGAGLGLIFGVLMGIFPRVNKFFSLIFDAIRQIPGIAWFPLIILWFGIGDLSKIILVARGTFFPVLVNTIDGIDSTNPKYIDLIKLYQVKLKDIIFKIYVPSALPFLCVGLRLGAGMAWMSVVAAEMLGAAAGLGFRIETSQQLMQSDVMIVDILIIGILGLGVDFLLKIFTSHLVKWEQI